MYNLDSIFPPEALRFAVLPGATASALRPFPARFAQAPAADEPAAGAGDDDASAGRRLQRAIEQEVVALLDDTKRAMGTVEQLLADAEALAEQDPRSAGAVVLRDFVGTQWWLLGAHARFGRRNAVQAVRCFDRAIAVMENEGGEAALMSTMAVHIALADALRFASGEPRRAATEYGKVVEWAAGAFQGLDGAGALRWALRHWLEAEINFVTQGRRYQGGPDARAIAALDIVMSAPPRQAHWVHPDVVAQGEALRSRKAGLLERAAFATQLERLPQSQLHLLACYDFLPLLGTAERVVRFIRRHDPAGFLSANLFARQVQIDKANAEGRRTGETAGMNAGCWSREDRLVMHRAARVLAGPATAGLAAGAP